MPHSTHLHRRILARFTCGSGRLVLTGFFLAAATLSAPAATLGPLKQISGPSPFASCTADDMANQDGVNYPESEIEPWIDASPRYPSNLIAGWQQDRWSNGGSRSLVSSYTLDAGATWHTVVVPKITACAGGTYKRASDPWVSIAPNGTAYFFSLSFDPDLPNGAFGPNAVLVNRSTNGGQTWGDPITLIADPAGQTLNDKNALTADDTNTNYAYAVWDRLRDFTLPTGPTAAAAAAPRSAVHASAGPGDGVLAARQRMQQLRRLAASGASPRAAQIFFEGPAFFSRTTNGGLNWELAKKIFDPGGNAQTIANQVVVRPNGAVYDFFTHIFPNGGLRIGFVKSFDKGATFGKVSYAAAISTVNGVVTPDEQELVRDASILFDVAVDPHNGNLYLAWQDVRFDGLDEVAFTMSTNGGTSWSPPVRINKTPANANELRRQAFLPSIEVGADGKLIVTYYDFRFDTDDGREAADHFALFCNPGQRDCRKSQNWGGERRLTTASFDLLNAPNAGGLFLGDYVGLVASRNVVYPAFGVVDGAGTTSIFTRPITIGGNNAAVARTN